MVKSISRCLLASLILITVAGSCADISRLFDKRRDPITYLIPDGFRGWVSLQYGNPNALPLPREGEYLIVRFSDQGTAETSSALQAGKARDRYFFYNEAGRLEEVPTDWNAGGMKWGDCTVYYEEPGGANRVYHYAFFVGTEEEFNQTELPEPLR